MVYSLYSPADRQCLLLLNCDPNFLQVCSVTPENSTLSGQTYFSRQSSGFSFKLNPYCRSRVPTVLSAFQTKPLLTKNFHLLCGENTIRNRLRAAGLKARGTLKAAKLTRQHRRRRLEWARRHLRFTLRQWDTVLFTDECRIQLSRPDGRQRVWRRRNERFRDLCVMAYNRRVGGSVHFWAGICLQNKTRLVMFDHNVTANTYINYVLQPAVIPFFRHHFRCVGGIWQQDGARPQ